MQSRKMSALETIASTAIGYTVATAANYFILPLFGHKVSLADASWIGVIFTVISLVRGYLVRRFFNWLPFRKIYSMKGDSSILAPFVTKEEINWDKPND